jgi:hypothetical protein
MKKLNIHIAYLFLFCLCLPLTSFAVPESSHVATVVAVNGSVIAIDQNGTQRTIALKNKLFQSDTIKTGRRGKIQFMFIDNTLISLGRNTEMKIAEYKWDENSKDGTLKTEVKEGAFRIMGGYLAKNSPEKFKTITPSATIGIRGSMYSGLVEGASLSVVFQAGKGIEIINKFGTVLITKPGYGSHVRGPDSPPEPPRKFTTDDLKKLNNAITGESGMQEDESSQGEEEAPPQDEETPPDEGEELQEEGETSTEEQGPAASDQSSTADSGTEPEESGGLTDSFDLPATDTTLSDQTQADLSAPDGTPPEPSLDNLSTTTDVVPEIVTETITTETTDETSADATGTDTTDTGTTGTDFTAEAIASKDAALQAQAAADGAKQETIDATSLPAKNTAQQNTAIFAVDAQTAADKAAQAAANTTDPAAQLAKDQAQLAADSAAAAAQAALEEYNNAFNTVDLARDAAGNAAQQYTNSTTAQNNAITATSLAERSSELQAVATAVATAQNESALAETYAGQTNAMEAAQFANNARTSTDNTAQIQTDINNNYKTDLSGKFLSVLSDTNFADGSNDTVWRGDVNGNSLYGHVIGETTDGGVTFTDGAFFPLVYTNPTYSQTATSYNGYFEDLSVPLDVFILGKTFNFTGAVYYSPMDQFYAYGPDHVNFTDAINYDFGMSGFFGVPTTAVNMPTTGISKFGGGYFNAVTSRTNSNIEQDGGPFFMLANWHNKKVVGVFDTDPDSTVGNPIPFFADVSGSTLTNVTFLGSAFSSDTLQITALDGTSDFAQFYGDQYQGFGILANGSSIDMQNQTEVLETWQSIASAYRGVEATPKPSPTGTMTWNGFFTGLAEDMTNPDMNRYLLSNRLPGDFQFIIDADTGELSGTMSSEYSPGGPVLTAVEIGGAYGSAYVTDGMFVSLLGCSTNCIEQNGFMGQLNTYGNFMMPAAPRDPDFSQPEQQFAEYATWGYWEASYQDPFTALPMHIHVPGSLWIAGEQTDPAEIAQLAGSSVIAHYVGGAEGIKVDPNVSPGIPQVTKLTNGVTDLTVDFANLTAASSLAGSISFSEVTLNINSVAAEVGTNGFNILLQNGTNPNLVAGDVNGAFFGPNAASIGGNFKAEFSGSPNNIKYMGVFGGDR